MGGAACSDCGEPEAAVLSGRPVCGPCAAARRRRARLWIAAGAVALAGISFAAVRLVGRIRLDAALGRAERLIAEGRCADASRELAGVLESHPDCARAILLKVKADVLSDSFETALDLALRHRGRRFEEGLFGEVNQLLERAHAAWNRQALARKLESEGRTAEAVRELEEAVRLYPESGRLKDSLLWGRGLAAFDRGDYDAFLALAREFCGRHPDSARARAWLASALACKYAVTADETLRTEARAELAKSIGLARDPREMAYVDEYAERIEHRLRTREIIPKEEYDRRFRGRQ